MKDRVRIVYMGKQAMVPADQVKNLQRKEKLVKMGRELDAKWKAAQGFEKQMILIELQNTMSKIQRLNRSIPPCVQFLD